MYNIFVFLIPFWNCVFTFTNDFSWSTGWNTCFCLDYLLHISLSLLQNPLLCVMHTDEFLAVYVPCQCPPSQIFEHEHFSINSWIQLFLEIILQIFLRRLQKKMTDILWDSPSLSFLACGVVSTSRLPRVQGRALGDSKQLSSTW